MKYPIDEINIDENILMYLLQISLLADTGEMLLFEVLLELRLEINVFVLFKNDKDEQSASF